MQPPEPVDQVVLPRLLVSVKTALEAAQLPYSPMTGPPSVQISFKPPSGNTWTTILQTDENAEVMAVMSFVPGQVPEKERPAVALALADFNAGFLHGSYDLSKTGTISYRTSTHVRGGQLSQAMVQNEVSDHFHFMEKHLPELRKLVAASGGGSAAGQPVPGQPAQTPVGANHPLVGNWKTIYRDATGFQIAQVVALNADGTFIQIAATSNGVTVQLRGDGRSKITS